jgi:hypothetical protein
MHTLFAKVTSDVTSALLWLLRRLEKTIHCEICKEAEKTLPITEAVCVPCEVRADAEERV